ncbi:hypothetical protein REC12_16455 [Desulfosporosinus sp. PR]|nr:hypothetical protein [Desulfosporosinus sp. PR]
MADMKAVIAPSEMTIKEKALNSNLTAVLVKNFCLKFNAFFGAFPVQSRERLNFFVGRP